MRRLLFALAVVLLLLPAAAQAKETDDSALRDSGTLVSPAIALVQFQISAFVQDNQTGDIYGYDPDPSKPLQTGAIGTGFFITPDGFLITAAHLAAPTPDQMKATVLHELFMEVGQRTGDCAGDACDAYATGRANDYFLRTTLTGLSTSLVVYTQDLDFTDISPSGLKAEMVASSSVSERDTAVIKVSGDNYPTIPLGDSSQVEVQDPVSIIGYPGIAFNFADAKSTTTPTITTGTITAKKQANGVDVLQTDATAEHGNSGGPMINKAGEVVGIVSFGPTSTTNFMIPSNDVKTVVRRAGVEPHQGKIDKLWEEGLTKYRDGKYGKSIDLFQQCLNLSKVHVGCRDFLKLAQAKPAAKSSFPVVPVAALIVVLGGAAFLTYRKVQSGRPVTVVSSVPAPPVAAIAMESPAAAEPQAAESPTPQPEPEPEETPAPERPVITLDSPTVMPTTAPAQGNGQLQPGTVQVLPTTEAPGRCTKCSGELGTNAHFCPQCGFPVA
jgi:S1-C subfamily serine protease